MKKIKRSHIEFFAGCGGMTVGLHSAGFKLKFASEVSPMASDTFAYNILGVDITKPSPRVKWIHSRFSSKDFSQRLRENLLTHDTDENVDFKDDPSLNEIENSLLIGDIRKLRDKFKKIGVNNPYYGNLDLISGGPPCQSFSLAGKREKNNYKNSLPLDFAEICELLNPKVVLLENVKGILSAFKEGNSKYYAWFEVAKAFSSKGFVPICMLVNSKYFGVAQNRPRYIMMAFRYDIFLKLLPVFPGNKILENSFQFISKIRSKEEVSYHQLNFYDIEKNPDLFDGKLLPKPVSVEENRLISVHEAINDLSTKGNKEKSNYTKKVNSLLDGKGNSIKVHSNHNPRNHSVKIQNRFLFFQLLNFLGTEDKSLILNHVKEIDSISAEKLNSIFHQLKKTSEEFSDVFQSFKEFEDFINKISLTRKHSQRALEKAKPSPAQLTIPDDTCHYSLFENRVLTVREMARIQSFPDSFQFRSKETTGGQKRTYEVPQYTQVGNAVPPMLAYHIGKHIKLLLDKSES